MGCWKDKPFPADGCTPHQRREARARLEAGESQTDIARSYAVD